MVFITVWNSCMSSLAVWGPSADRSRLEVQLHPTNGKLNVVLGGHR